MVIRQTGCWGLLRLALGTTLVLGAALACPLNERDDFPPNYVGVYHWLGNVPHRASSDLQPNEMTTDALTAALGDLEQFGFRTVRIFLGGRYDYMYPKWAPQRFVGISKPITLAKILALPRYRRILEHPQFKTIWLTAYPVLDYGRGPDEIDLSRDVSENEWNEEYAQLHEMVEWLYRHFGDREKVILISNHEVDEKMREVLNATDQLDLAVGNVVRDLEERFKAVKDAREKFPSARLKILTGVEISLWKLKLARASSGRYIKGGSGLNALEAVLPQLEYDFVSFSAWELLARNDIGAALVEALGNIESRTRGRLTPTGQSFFGKHHVLVGEFGYAREWSIPWVIRKAGFEAVARALESGHIRYAIYWQLYDNVEGEVKEFGLLDPRGKITCSGMVLLTLLRGTLVVPKHDFSCDPEDQPRIPEL